MSRTIGAATSPKLRATTCDWCTPMFLATSPRLGPNQDERHPAKYASVREPPWPDECHSAEWRICPATGSNRNYSHGSGARDRLKNRQPRSILGEIAIPDLWRSSHPD